MRGLTEDSLIVGRRLRNVGLKKRALRRERKCHRRGNDQHGGAGPSPNANSAATTIRHLIRLETRRGRVEVDCEPYVGGRPLVEASL